MRQNIISAVLQTGASLGIAVLSVAIFRVMTPDQIAVVRQHYFVPFAIITSLAPANQNYLRSVLFSQRGPQDIREEIRSLVTVQSLGSFGLFAAIVLVLVASGTSVSWLNAVSLLTALALVQIRTLVTGFMEFAGRYSLSIALSNLGTAIPYIATFSVLFTEHMSIFFVTVTVLLVLNTVLIVTLGRSCAPRSIEFLRHPLPNSFSFQGGRYLQISLIAMGSVAVYQGVEFCLYNFTRYSDSEIANYALTFSACAVLRQIIIVALQPLEHERYFSARISLGRRLSVSRPVGIEFLVYVGLIAAVLVMPWLLVHFFPKFDSAGSFVAPLIVGVLGSATQQIYTVRMIAEGRTAFLGISQIVLAVSCVLVALLLNPYVTLRELMMVIAGLIWLRGCVMVPAYAELAHRKRAGFLWLSRIGLSSVLLYSAL